jgi:DNA invertase Pin-like site-specific DNA recombinase
MKIGYRRVSTKDQNPDRQLEGLQFDRLFTDYASGKNADRPELEEMINFARIGDTVFVHSLDRLARNLWDLKKIVDRLQAKQVEVRFIKENLIFNGSQSPMSILLFSVLGAFAEFERSIIRERQKEGITLARARGVYDRKPPLTSDQIQTAHLLLEAGVPKAAVARKLEVARSTLYVYLKGSAPALVS